MRVCHMLLSLVSHVMTCTVEGYPNLNHYNWLHVKGLYGYQWQRDAMMPRVSWAASACLITVRVAERPHYTEGSRHEAMIGEPQWPIYRLA